MSDEAAGGKCLIGSNGKDLIINAGIQNGRNESCADTLQLMRSGLSAGKYGRIRRFYCYDLHIGVLGF